MACLICNQKGKLSPVAGHEAIVPSAESLEVMSIDEGCSHAKSDGHKKELGAIVGMRQTPVVSRSMASSPRERAAPHRMLLAAEVGGLLTGCSGPPGFESCLFRSLYLRKGE